ncbi:MAG: hypothetical protein Greene041619_1134 [Candidatus Peregrinibacteria bacterium Greene0416_19]|nr:MAG: hypothetical protein Greene041619_1134 [Candidatus Peregrinibacteria bacterium Greene0416_19]
MLRLRRLLLSGMMAILGLLGTLSVPVAVAQDEDEYFPEPEDVLMHIEDAKQGYVHINSRLAEKIVEERERERQAQVDAIKAGAGPSDSPAVTRQLPREKRDPVTEEPTADAPALEDAASGDDADTLPVLDARSLRTLERIERNRALGQTAGAGDSTLHSGAPLAPTGPASALTLLVIGCAVAWTLLRARRMGRMRMW